MNNSLHPRLNHFLMRKWPFLALPIALLFASCATQSVYLQSITVDGPQAQPPLFITRDNTPGDFRVAPRFAVNARQTLVGRSNGHFKVNSQGVYQVDTINANGAVRYYERDGVNTNIFQGRNFSWDATRWDASVECEYIATPMLSLVGGVSYSSAASQDFLGANLGVGFFFEGKNLAVRVDIGAHAATTAYDVQYVVTQLPFWPGSRDTEVFFRHEKGKNSHVNAYGAFTLNSKVTDWPLQFFVQAAINRQTIAEFDTQVSNAPGATVLQSVSYFILSPGVYFDLSSKSRVLMGMNLRDETQLLEADPGVLLTSFVQFEFVL